MKVCFSGTFNILHKGHKHLIDFAFKTAGINGTVYIGITEGDILNKKKFAKPLSKRIKIIKDYLKVNGYEKRAVIKIIYDQLGPAISGDFDAIIVSPESFKNAEEINNKRIKNGLKPLKILKLEFVLAEDNKPISSTRIFNKEIDTDGRIIR